MKKRNAESENEYANKIRMFVINASNMIILQRAVDTDYEDLTEQEKAIFQAACNSTLEGSDLRDDFLEAVLKSQIKLGETLGNVAEA